MICKNCGATGLLKSDIVGIYCVECIGDFICPKESEEEKEDEEDV